MDNQYKGLGITSMVLGIVSILLCWTVVMSGLCAVVGAGLGVYYLSKRKQERGFAIAGIATSAFGLILSVFAVAIILIAGTVESQVPSIEEQTPYSERWKDSHQRKRWCLSCDRAEPLFEILL